MTDAAIRRPHVGVVGGGIAGLTAAYRFARLGYDVTLWEPGARLGGQAAAFPVLGTALEYFYHHLFMSDHDIVQLMRDLGIEDRLVWLSSRVGFYTGGKIYPLSGALDLLRMSCIPFHDRIRLGLVTLYLQKQKAWAGFERVTAASWLRRWVGRRAYDRVWGAQLRAKFGESFDQVAMVWFWNKVFLRTQSRKSLWAKEELGYIRGSFNVLIDRLAEAIEAWGGSIQVGVGVTQLRQGEHGWSVESTDGESTQVDVVVATIPSPVLSKLVPDLPDTYRSKLSGAIYQAAVTMLLQTSHALTDTYWLNISDPSVPLTAIIEHTNFISSDDYQGKHFIYLSKYVEQSHPFLRLSEDELFEAYLPTLRRLNPNFRPDWVERRWLFRERAAQPIITLKYSERIPEHRTPLAGLYLANTSQIYPEDRGTNYSVRLGNQIVELVDDDFRSKRGSEEAHSPRTID